MDDSDPLVSIRHLRAAGVCAQGGRNWCRDNGVDWREFVTKGVRASVLEASGHPVSTRVAAQARKELTDGR